MALELIFLTRMSPLKPHIRIPVKRYERSFVTVVPVEQTDAETEIKIHTDITINPSAVITSVKQVPLNSHADETKNITGSEKTNG